MIFSMRRNPSTVVVLVGEVPDALLAAVGRSLNVSVIRPAEAAGGRLEQAAEALSRASRTGSPYVLVPADPLAAVAEQWRAMWDPSRESPGAAEFEVQAGLALAAWRAGRFELPDYYLDIAAAPAGEQGSREQAPREQAPREQGPHQQGPHQQGPHEQGPDLYLGPLRSARTHRVALVAAPGGPERAARVLQTLGSLRPGPWWPPLDELLEISRRFYPGSLAEGDAALSAPVPG
jgi:hypothetical protein